jgi:hypothetical protein
VVAANDLLNSSVHAVKAAERPGSLSAVNPLVKLLRNVHEHWDETRETFVEGGPPKVHSGKALAHLSDVSPWRFAYSNTPDIGITLGPLPLTSLDFVLEQCALVTSSADPDSTLTQSSASMPEPPRGLLATTIVGQLIHNPTLGLSLFQPVITVWDPDLME